MLKSLVSGMVAYATRLRFPNLFILTLVLFAVNLVVPDMIPFLDEILLGLVAALLAAWKKRKTPEAPKE